MVVGPLYHHFGWIDKPQNEVSGDGPETWIAVERIWWRRKRFGRDEWQVKFRMIFATMGNMDIVPKNS